MSDSEEVNGLNTKTSSFSKRRETSRLKSLKDVEELIDTAEHGVLSCSYFIRPDVLRGVAREWIKEILFNSKKSLPRKYYKELLRVIGPNDVYTFSERESMLYEAGKLVILKKIFNLEE